MVVSTIKKCCTHVYKWVIIIHVNTSGNEIVTNPPYSHTFDLVECFRYKCLHLLVLNEKKILTVLHIKIHVSLHKKYQNKQSIFCSWFFNYNKPEEKHRHDGVPFTSIGHLPCPQQTPMWGTDMDHS